MITDQQKIVDDAKNNPEAFGQIFDMHYSQILRYVTRRTGDVAVAEDITAETFLKAFNSIAAFSWRGVPLAAWLYRIATNELRMYYRKNQHYTMSLDKLFDETGFEIIDNTLLEEEAMRAQDVLEQKQAYMRALQIIHDLPLKYQEVVVLRYVEEKKVSEIAEILCKREGTVKSLLSRGISKLRVAMQRNEKSCIIEVEGKLNNASRGMYEEQ